MSDDSLVADALLLLRHSEPTPPPKKAEASPIKLKWSVRQRRSKKGDQTRASPTTPLSLSGATSLSGGSTTVEGLGESSATVKPSETFRSKVCLDHFTRFIFGLPDLKTTCSTQTLRQVLFRASVTYTYPSRCGVSNSHRSFNEFPCCLGLSVSNYTLDLTQTATRRDLGSIHDRPSLLMMIIIIQVHRLLVDQNTPTVDSILGNLMCFFLFFSQEKLSRYVDLVVFLETLLDLSFKTRCSLAFFFLLFLQNKESRFPLLVHPSHLSFCFYGKTKKSSLQGRCLLVKSHIH